MEHGKIYADEHCMQAKSFRFRFQYANYSKSLLLPRCRLKNKETSKVVGGEEFLL